LQAAAAIVVARCVVAAGIAAARRSRASDAAVAWPAVVGNGGHLRHAGLTGMRAAGVEQAAGGGAMGFGTSPASSRRGRSRPRLGQRDRRQQRLRVRVARRLEQCGVVPASSTMRPRYITATRVAMWRTTARLWEMKR
jgi:hypothetical protein